MPKTSFQILDNATLCFGERTVSCHFSEELFLSKYLFMVEGNSDERDKLGQRLFMHDFKEIQPQDLPNGIHIMIQSPKSEFKQISFAESEKFNDQSKLTITQTIEYSDWHLPVNLISFSENYQHKLTSDVDGAIDCVLNPDERGTYIVLAISVAPGTDYFSAYLKAAAQILSIYRKCLDNIYQKPVSQVEKEEKPNEASGAKWWFQYVIVPILGSSAVAALAAGLIALLK